MAVRLIPVSAWFPSSGPDRTPVGADYLGIHLPFGPPISLWLPSIDDGARTQPQLMDAVNGVKMRDSTRIKDASVGPAIERARNLHRVLL